MLALRPPANIEKRLEKLAKRMRTTLDINDALLKKARRHAAKKGTSLTSVVEESLQRYFTPAKKSRERVSSRWIVVRGKGPPAVDIADRDRLFST